MWARVSILAGMVSAAGLLLGAGACGPSAPTAPTTGPTPPLDRTAVIEALDYWRSAVGLDYVLIDNNAEPRLLARPGYDGLASQGGGRGGIDGTYSNDNQARSGLVVIEPGGGQYCRTMGSYCRYLYRHEIGHALGFLGHSDGGLMKSTPETLLDRERRMILALYSLPHGARVGADGNWSVPATGAAGKLDDVQAAQDVIAWNMNAQGGASYRELGTITRWELPVRVYLQNWMFGGE
jgi:hypothetical protein